MRKTRVGIVLAAAVLAGAASTASASLSLSGRYTTYIASPALLKGTWQIAFGRGTYTTSVRGRVLTHGTDTISGSVITFHAQGAGTCPTPGRYGVTLSGRTLRFRRISDPCPYRPTVLSHTYTKA
jgi:hypothetical protein